MVTVALEDDSGSFSVEIDVGNGEMEEVEGPAVALVVDSLCELAASCHDGIDGRPTKLGTGDGDGAAKLGPRLSRSAFSDFSSCCSSPRDCVWFSLFFSIICKGNGHYGIRGEVKTATPLEAFHGSS